MQVKEILKDKANRFGNKPALIFKEKTVTFGELLEQTYKFCHSLKEIGIQKGDKVALFMPNSLECVYSYLALFCMGAVVVPLDYMLKEEELVSCISHSEAKLLIIRPKDGVSPLSLKERIPTLKDIIISYEEKHPHFYIFDDFVSRGQIEEPDIKVEESDNALIFYTSGTTGRPKGVLLNYKHLDGSPMAMDYFVDLSDKDTKLCALPLTHFGGLVYLQNCIYYGITLIIMDRFNPLEFLRNVEQYKVTCFHLVPSMYIALLQLKEFEKYDLSSIRWVNVFGAPSSPEVLKRFMQYCPQANLLHGWGMTETSPPNTVIPMGSPKIHSVGLPAPWIDLRIVDENDKELPRGEVGEIVMKSWAVMVGYYKDPEETARVMRNGWFHTGDLGKIDVDGYLYIMGRIKEMIKVGGEIVYATEVEDVIHKIPEIQEVAVIGVEDKLRGEVVKAFISLKDGVKLSEDEIRHFCRQNLANFKVPHYIEIRDRLPKTRTDKIDKKALK